MQAREVFPIFMQEKVPGSCFSEKNTCIFAYPLAERALERWVSG
jgi:hypothetical protein